MQRPDPMMPCDAKPIQQDEHHDNRECRLFRCERDHAGASSRPRRPPEEGTTALRHPDDRHKCSPDREADDRSGESPSSRSGRCSCSSAAPPRCRGPPRTLTWPRFAAIMARSDRTAKAAQPDRVPSTRHRSRAAASVVDSPTPEEAIDKTAAPATDASVGTDQRR